MFKLSEFTGSYTKVPIVIKKYWRVIEYLYNYVIINIPGPFWKLFSLGGCPISNVPTTYIRPAMLFIIQAKPLECYGCHNGTPVNNSLLSFCQSSHLLSTWCTLGMRVKKGVLCIQSVVLCAGEAPAAWRSLSCAPSRPLFEIPPNFSCLPGKHGSLRRCKRNKTHERGGFWTPTCLNVKENSRFRWWNGCRNGFWAP